VLAGEPNGQIVLVLRPTSAVPDDANRATAPSRHRRSISRSFTALHGWTLGRLRAKESGPGSPSPERVQGRLQQIFLSCSSRTL